MEFTGERLVPGLPEERSLWQEHLARYRLACYLIERDQCVLDLGCGTGYGAFELSQIPGIRMTGLDLSSEAIAYSVAQFSSENLGFAQADANALPFLGAYFDAVVSFEVIEHLSDPQSYLAQIQRVLKEEGFCVISTPNREVYSPGMDQPWNPFHVKEYSISEFIQLLQQVFPFVLLIKQYHVDGYLMNLADGAETDKDIRSLQYFPIGSFAEAPYLVALCALSANTFSKLQRQLNQLLPAMYADISRYSEVEELKVSINSKEHELDVLYQHLRAIENGRFMRLLNWGTNLWDQWMGVLKKRG